MSRVKSMGGLFSAISGLTTSAVDATDILRSQIVLVVSALDHYVHELTRLGMLEIFDGHRSVTPAFERFRISASAYTPGLSHAGMRARLEAEIRMQHSYLAFQQPDKIADAIRLFSPVSLWDSVGARLGSDAAQIKNGLKAIVDRRNKIAHEADLDPSFPGTRWPINLTDNEAAVRLISDVCENIHASVI